MMKVDYITLTAGEDVKSRVCFENEYTWAIGYALGPFISMALSLLSSRISFFDTQLVLTTSTIPVCISIEIFFLSLRDKTKYV